MSSSRPMTGLLTVHEEARDAVARGRTDLDIAVLAHRVTHRDTEVTVETTVKTTAKLGRLG